MLDQIFIKGWEINILLYGVVFLLGQYLVYKIIFRSLIGSPKSFYWEDIKHWNRKASFIGAVIFAPLFEEVMFTYLAYTTFLQYSLAGMEGVVVVFVASFFAVLHFPGDFRQMGYRLNPWTIYLLIRFQLHRFFFSLAAFFIYQSWGYLLVTICLHYFINAIVSLYNFDLEDDSYAFEENDGRLLLIRFINIGLAASGTYFFFIQYPDYGLYLIPFAAFTLLDYLYWQLKKTN